MDLESTDLKDFLYDLPEDRIAKHPLAARDGAKLLIHRNDKITHEKFKNAAAFIPKDSLFFLNNTKVVANIEKLIRCRPMTDYVNIIKEEPLG